MKDLMPISENSENKCPGPQKRKSAGDAVSTLSERRARRPGNRENIDRIKASMYEEAKQYRLRNLREEAGVTQVVLAREIGVGQNRVSQMEHGNISTARVSTLRKYVQALGADLEINIRRADGTRVPLDLGDTTGSSDLAEA